MTHILSLNAKLKAALMILFIFSALTLTTVSVVLAGGDGENPLHQEVADVAAAQIDDPISDTELRDLQTVAEQAGISLQDAIDRYGWNNNFALAVSRIKGAVPGDFAGAEIVDASHAWIAFSGTAPQEALDIIDTFSSSHRGVSVEVRTDLGFNETELQKAIEDVHYGTLSAPETLDASTSFDYETGQITTVVVLDNTASDSDLDYLQAVAATNLADATRTDIHRSVTATVISSDHDVLGGVDSDSEHLGGEILSSGLGDDCTSGFGVKNSSGRRGVSTAGHCPNNLKTTTPL